MKIVAELPVDRTQEGRGWVKDENGTVLVGPFRCRGKADNQMAIAHHNAVRNPEQAYGDHPSGGYKVVSVHESVGEEIDHYGKYFLLLDPVSGDALIAKANGRTGIGWHGGLLLPDGSLRPTYGCDRVENATDEQVGPMAEQELGAGREIDYECRDV